MTSLLCAFTLNLETQKWLKKAPHFVEFSSLTNRHRQKLFLQNEWRREDLQKAASVFYFFAPWLKGEVPRYTVIFRAFLREQKWQLLALVSRISDLNAWPAVRHGSFATYAGYWQCSEPTTSRARVALLHLSTATGSAFYSLYEARPRWNPLLQSSRLAATDISIMIIDSRLSFCVPSEAGFSDLVAEGMSDWKKESAVWP